MRSPPTHIRTASGGKSPVSSPLTPLAVPLWVDPRFLLFNMVIVQVDAGRAAVVLNLIPVFGVASAVLFLGEGMSGRDAVGAVLIGSSVVYFAIADHREATAQALCADQGCGKAPARHRRDSSRSARDTNQLSPARLIPRGAVTAAGPIPPR